MQRSQEHHNSAGIHWFNHQSQEIDPYGLSHIQILNNNLFSDVGSQGITVSFQTDKEEYFTLESSAVAGGFVVYDSPAASFSSSRSPFSSQGSHSCLTDPHHSPDNTYGSPMSGSSSADDDNVLMRQKLRELEFLLLGSELDITNDANFCFHQADRLERWDWTQMVEMILVSGTPMQRLGAYMLEGLRARVELSGSKIYRASKCEAPLSSDLMTYMGILSKICPYWRFAYAAANVVIREAVEYEPRIHIIDFQIAQGTQWLYLIQSLADQPGGPPSIHITGVDDPQSAHARGGGLHIKLGLQPGEAVVVNFPYVLHHMPDESVNTWNHRDRLLRLVKSLSPKVVTLIEQESNTNTKPFLPRFKETLEYYTAMFESIDAGSSRDDKQRINAEQHCVARDIVDVIACEGADRVERHELFGKWRSRFIMAGFTQYPLTSTVTGAVRDLLREYDRNYGLQEKDGALYLWWINTAMTTFSAWR
ncbi:hypothetical protein GH714_042438 [Hevea brasiliensis]|uniref:Uncharacterized protein n=1 Tax=Hevea brasiliensis TaxID=3981 RepID=A0A6A6KM68_HEVBR|nr:hypothetical protein GH714_042438 [Hevea brasiliensis]